MPPDKQEDRPAAPRTANPTACNHADDDTHGSTLTSGFRRTERPTPWRRTREARRRVKQYAVRHLSTWCLPSNFGLGRDDLQREIARCRANGWQMWELDRRFTNPRFVPTKGIR